MKYIPKTSGEWRALAQGWVNGWQAARWVLRKRRELPRKTYNPQHGHCSCLKCNPDARP